MTIDSHRVYSLVFDYNIKTVTDSGRHWAQEVYKNKDHIFGYTAASVATFLHHNPNLPYMIYTDDVELFQRKIDAYDVPQHALTVVDLSDAIAEWKSHWYSFWPLVKIVEMNHDGLCDALKLDNDLTCLKPIDDLLAHRGAVAWKRERMCSGGREYWGERKAARVGLGTEDFPIFNMGTLGLTKEYQHNAGDIVKYCEKLIAVDVSDVSHFPDAPGKKTHVWNASEQTAVNYFLHVNKVPILESHPWIMHHCYEKTKDRVFTDAAYLLRKHG